MKPHSFCHRNLESGTFSFVIDSSEATFPLQNTKKAKYEVLIRENCYRLLNTDLTPRWSPNFLSMSRFHRQGRTHDNLN